MNIGLMAIGVLVVVGLLLYGLYKFLTNVRIEDKPVITREGYVEFGTTPPYDIPRPANENQKSKEEKIEH